MDNSNFRPDPENIREKTGSSAKSRKAPRGVVFCEFRTSVSIRSVPLPFSDDGFEAQKSGLLMLTRQSKVVPSLAGEKYYEFSVLFGSIFSQYERRICGSSWHWP